MAVSGYPKRYARAIFEIALEQNTIEKWDADLNKLSGLPDEKELLLLLESPRLTFEDKKQLLEKHLEGVSPMAQNVAYLLMERNKIGLLSSILQQYRQMVDLYTGTTRARVTTAVPLEQTELNKIGQTLETITGKKIIMDIDIDPAIIGGFIARINGTLLDGSTRNKLQTLKKEMSGISS